MLGGGLRLAIGEQVKLDARPFGDVGVELSVFGYWEVLYELTQLCLAQEEFGSELWRHYEGS